MRPDGKGRTKREIGSGYPAARDKKEGCQWWVRISVTPMHMC